MEDISVFTDKNAEPAESDLSKTELKSAKVNAEGRGSEINRLLEICMSYILITYLLTFHLIQL